MKLKPGSLFFIYVLVSMFATLSSQPTEGLLLSNWRPDTIPGSQSYHNAFNEVWGYAKDGFEYAIIGSTLGTHIVNVTDPENPNEDFFIKGASSGNHIIHRDYHDYKGYLYAISGEDIGTSKSTLQIIDLNGLPEKVEVVYDSRDRIRKAHNIFIDTSQARLYACSAKNGDDPFSPLRIYDISNPIDPILLESYSNGIGGVQIGHVHDAFVSDNIAFLNAGFDGLLIVDFSDTANPLVLSHLLGTDYPESGYNHSGWLSQDGKYYFMGDESWGSAMKVLDVTELQSVEVVGTFESVSNSDFSIPHNQVVQCNYLFVSYYYDGLKVYDISDPENPINILFYNTTNLPAQPSYEGAWGVYPFLPSGNILVSDMQNGLFVIENFDVYCTPSKTEEQKLEDLDLRVYPNPNPGFFEIKCKYPINKLKLFDLNGRLLYESKTSISNTYQLKYLKSGIYFAEIYVNDIRWVEKIIIQK